MAFSDDNKRIAKNTVLLYVRIIISQVIALYTSRKILDVLGVDDFGIQNIVGGIVTMLTFFNSTMAGATSRFLTIELGKNDMAAFKKVFSMSCWIHILLAILILIIGETVGLWFVNNCLNIPEHRMFAANVVYQASIFSMLLGVIQTPYNAAITAHEHFNIYAFVGIGESVIRLGLVLILACLVTYDTLIIYSLMTLCLCAVITLCYRWYCVKHYKECRISLTRDKSLFKGMLFFSGWTTIGNLSWFLKEQGANVLLNLFGGPAVNAARGVALQVSGALNSLVSGFTSAVNPQLTKNYASNDKERLTKLLFTSSKIAFFLLLFLAVPVILELPYLLKIWLVEVPAHTVWFARFILLETLLATLTGPVITSINATGNIKWTQITVGGILLLNLPIAYACLKMGMPLEGVFIVSLLVSLVAHLARIRFAQRLVGISAKSYVASVILPILCVLFTAPWLPAAVYFVMPQGSTRLVVTTIASTASIGLCVFYIGFNSKERALLLNMILPFVSRFRLPNFIKISAPTND